MKYRAIAVGLRVNERPVQVYGGDIVVIRDWARKTVEQHGVAVDIMATEERLLERVDPKKEQGK
jgi:co-chaperonin GroES (HSP10)